MTHHGTFRTYDRERCRCDDCRRANAVYKAMLELRHRRGDVWADPAPVAEHLAPVLDLGVSPSAVGKAAGVYYKVVRRVMAGQRVRTGSALRLLETTVDDLPDTVRMSSVPLEPLLADLAAVGMSQHAIAREAWGWTEWQPLTPQVVVGRWRALEDLHARVCGFGVACADCGAEPWAGGRWCWPCYRTRSNPKPPRRPTGCGTDAGYAAHRRAGTDPCRACAVAHNEAQQRRKAAA